MRGSIFHFSLAALLILIKIFVVTLEFLSGVRNYFLRTTFCYYGLKASFYPIIEKKCEKALARDFLAIIKLNSMEAFEKSEMTTMTSCTNHLLKEGFSENFVVKSTGIEAPSTEKLYTPSEVRI